MQQVSVWEKESFYAHKNVIIAGSGFVGLWSAYYLKKNHPKLSIAIVDRGIIPTGASTRNAGFACFGSVTELIADTLKSGEEQMLDIVEMRYKGLKRIRKIFKDKEIGYEDFGGYELVTGSQDFDLNILRSNIDYLNRKLKKIVKKEKSFYINDDKISEFGFAGIQHLIENKLEGQLHSGKLCQALLKLVVSMGVTVLNSIEIKNYERINGSIELHTNQHFNLSTDQLIICTNAFAKQLLPELDVEPARGQVLVTSEIPDLKWKGTFHYDEGYYYFRNLGNRVLLGGARNAAFEDEHTYELATSSHIQDTLENFLKEKILPATLFTIEHRWSGIMGVGKEKMPIVKKISDGVFCAVRMGGMGVALAPVIGEQIAELITT
ncbi:MAG: FAD-binding oxidoreductase [Bacteroidetes bacterium]|nr:FAD-binding oxidoreductase [Bacteroidota bacterium]MBS1934129.1 FAD-binding oxidoreductase [Bacteroidota bacterium]